MLHIVSSYSQSEYFFLGSSFCHLAGDIKIRAKLGVDFIYSTICSVPVTVIYTKDGIKGVCVWEENTSELAPCLCGPVYTSFSV